jgi:hypothetical protein
MQNADKIDHYIATSHQAIHRRIVMNIRLHDRHSRMHQERTTMLILTRRHMHHMALSDQTTHDLSTQKTCTTNDQNTHYALQ